jgi:hypothetical protein
MLLSARGGGGTDDRDWPRGEQQAPAEQGVSSAQHSVQGGAGALRPGMAVKQKRQASGSHGWGCVQQAASHVRNSYVLREPSEGAAGEGGSQC